MDNKKLALYKDFETHDKGVEEGRKMTENGIVFMTHHLKEIKDKKLYLALGEGGNTWASYCAGKDINVHTADAYIKAYRFYVEDMGKPIEVIGSIPTDKLTKYLPALKKLEGEAREEAFEDLKVLSRSDLDRKFVEKKLMPPKPVELKNCDKCEKLIIYYDQDRVCQCKGFHAIYAKPVTE